MRLEKPTLRYTDSMATMRTYGDRCGVARALDVVGERWALLVVRELVLGPKRFSDLRAGLPRVAPDVLSQRLRELEETGVLRRRTLPPPSGARVYELTEWGQELEPLVVGLGRWGSRAPFPGGDAELGVDAFVIALKTLFDPAAAGDLDATIELRLGDDRFRASVEGGRFAVERGEAAPPDAAATADPGALAGVFWHGRPLDDVTVEGDRYLLARFVRAFPAPVPAS
jgi:DNA-binding HxlR family transcriptional regulator